MPLPYSDATVFPPTNADCKVGVRFFSTSGVLITGWTGAACVVLTNGVQIAAFPNVPVENGAFGMGYLDIPAAYMNGQMIQVHATITNAGATDFYREIETNGATQAAATTAAVVWNTADFGDGTGRANTVWQQLSQLWRFCYNGGFINKPSATITIYRDDGVTPMLAGPIVVNSAGATKVKMS